MIRYEVGDRRATVTIDDPDRRNPMSVPTMEGLLDGVRRAQADPSVRVVVLTGAGERVFSAGGDLAGGFVDDPIGLHRGRSVLAELLRELRRAGKPSIARVNGHALGGGFGLAAACDITVCVDDARLGLPEIDVGLWPMMVAAVLLDVMPRKAVMELMMTGRLIEPEEARALGAVTRVVARSQLDEAVDGVVAALVEKSPAAMLIGRDAVSGVADLGFDAALDRLQGGLTAVSLTEDAREGVAAFIGKRDTDWSGR